MHNIREALNQDLESIQRISRYLHNTGYSLEDFRESIADIERSDNDYLLVAECEGRVVGWIHYFYARRLATPNFFEIGGLVVDPDYRGKGIGKSLVNGVFSNGEGKYRVRCNEQRNDTHQFYRSLGFSSNKTQLVFEKQL